MHSRLQDLLCDEKKITGKILQSAGNESIKKRKAKDDGRNYLISFSWLDTIVNTFNLNWQKFGNSNSETKEGCEVDIFLLGQTNNVDKLVRRFMAWSRQKQTIIKNPASG